MLFVVLIIVFGIGLLNILKRDRTVDSLVSIYADDESGFYKWKGINVHFKDEGRGRSIIFLHGTSSSLHTWDKLTPYLKSHVRIIRVDLPGFGLTGPHPERDYSTKAYIQFLDEFTKFLNISSFFVAGNSWGGLLAWNYASRHQQKVSGLILIDAAGFRMSKIPKRFLACRSIIGRWILKHTMLRWLIKAGLQEVYSTYHITDNAEVTRYIDLSLRAGNRQAFLDFVRKRERPDLKLLQHIQSPTLILWGRLDNLYNVEQAFVFQENLPNATVAIVENAGHVPMEESPDVCATHIRKFLDTLHPV
jgi:pimeloyl-ACP methyl ester carboxylesterase